MYVTYHATAGSYVPFARQCGGFIVPGSPSPPLSLYSEPIFQPLSPIRDGRSGSPGKQEKTPKVQLLNKTIGDAQKKKTIVRGHQLPSRLEPPDMMNFFQAFSPGSDHLSESGDGNIRVSPVNPPSPYSNKPWTISPPKQAFQCTPVADPLCCPQVEQKGPFSLVPSKGQKQ